MEFLIAHTTKVQISTNIADDDGTSVSSHVDDFELEGKQDNNGKLMNRN